ncbi:MAG: tRNA guanosine(34) transglycosylase Tgt [Anaerolineaceae bacterium]|nr:tRNA guanosine(34) transglycosylase Tgt [Anaerolineaceae bacterium]
MKTNKYPSNLKLEHGQLDFPVYLPDATFGVVRSVDVDDLKACQVQAVVMNSFHLMQRPGSSTVQALGGLHGMSAWERPIITDSGGFQAYSLIRQNQNYGTIHDRGLSFKPDGSGRKFHLTPEKSIRLQISYGADVVICLDDCTHVDSSYEEQRQSVRRTIDWAQRSKETFQHLVLEKRISEAKRARIFAVIQGGGVKELRRECAESLLEIGFDGFGYGGWPLDNQGNLLEDILGYTRELIPKEYPLHALGVGHPENVLACHGLGYGLFDSAMPTRDARHGRLYAFSTSAEEPKSGLVDDWMRYIYINDERHIKDSRPISPHCDAICCQRYSIGYIRHLFKLNDSLFPRLATIHNLRFMTQLTERIREKKHGKN